MFSITGVSGKSRIGLLTTRSGVVNTPFFMPDATRASVRGITNASLGSVGVGPMVVNTYHLMLEPSADRVKRLGGMHEFMKWKQPLLSDSGGYLVYSLIHKHPEMGRITEEGAEFRSVLDGSKHVLTPERAIEIQFNLGTDMMVCLDDPRPNDAPREEIEAAVERTLRWAKRCRDSYDEHMQKRGLDNANRPVLFGVVQGGQHEDLRRKCAEGLVAIGFDGYGFGARHVDSSGNFLEEALRCTASMLPKDTPRFALGVGTPEDIVRCWRLGWDMFDCVIPTREGRHGRLFVQKKNHPVQNATCKVSSAAYGTINITNSKFSEYTGPIDDACDCPACVGGYSRAYLRHLFRSGETLGPHLATLHNLRFYVRLMEEMTVLPEKR